MIVYSVRYSCMQPFKRKPCGTEVTLTLKIPDGQKFVQIPELRCANCNGLPVMRRDEPVKENGGRIILPTAARVPVVGGN